jgi:hypothetical protein
VSSRSFLSGGISTNIGKLRVSASSGSIRLWTNPGTNYQCAISCPGLEGLIFVVSALPHPILFSTRKWPVFGQPRRRGQNYRVSNEAVMVSRYKYGNYLDADSIEWVKSFLWANNSSARF